MILNKSYDISKVMWKYNLSKSTWYKLRKDYLKNEENIEKVINLCQDIFWINREEILELIKFVVPTTRPLTINKILSNLNIKFNTSANYKAIMKYFKKIV